MEKGMVFEGPLIDFVIKNAELNYPVINEYQIRHFRWLTKSELKDLKTKAIRIHDFLNGLFASINIRLVELKLEFGKVWSEDEITLMLADEISPDNTILWDMDTNQSLCYELAHTSEKTTSKEIIEAYKIVAERLNLA
jgi:phosphoribosylaminoimidazole-succinocarboxamide synthase